MKEYKEELLSRLYIYIVLVYTHRITETFIRIENNILYKKFVDAKDEDTYNKAGVPMECR